MTKCSQCSSGRIRLTGIQGELNGRDKNRTGSHLLPYKLQYKCIKCGHLGWTRDPKWVIDKYSKVPVADL